MPQADGELCSDEFTANEKSSLSDLRQASQGLKTKIARAKKITDMPLNAGLGNPNWDKIADDRRSDAPKDDA